MYYNQFDIKVAQEQYQEVVRSVELAASAKREEMDAVASDEANVQSLGWKTFVQQGMQTLTGRRRALARTR